MKTYLAIAGGLPLLMVCSVAGTNYLVDPYLIHQWQTPQVQRLRAPIEKLNAWGKTYALALYRPDVIYLGNSRTELGLAVPKSGPLRVFNAALSGATVGDALRMLAHARRVADIRSVIWGIDAPSFTLSVGNTELENGLLASGGNYLGRRFLLDLQRAVSIDMTRASFDILGGQTPEICHASLAQFGQRDGECMRSRIAGWGGAAEVVGPRTREFLRGEGPTDGAMEALETSVRRACGLRWSLYVNPTHAMTIDAMYWAGRGGQYEEWLVRLAAMGKRLRQAGCDARLYDFSGFNGVTSEYVPQPGDSSEMRNYWETSHYRENVGDAILARLSGGPAAADGFGDELLPESMAAHIARLRKNRLAYLQTHRFEAATAHSIATNQAKGR
ncbi:hypothetical protein [Pseudoduganella violaceinigra]|uniref:hypothetical protein n=1 Tax=Pseudoduganella violaceinigra TaxID=246602 RepID=UPI000400285C|nr:hypothetical protein [Pseudoduganella violaceinigra]